MLPSLDQVVAVVALGGLDADVGLARRNHRPPAHAQEVRDERFDVVHRPLLERRRGQRMRRLVRARPACASTHCSMMRRLCRISSTRTTRAVVAVAMLSRSECRTRTGRSPSTAASCGSPSRSRRRAGPGPVDAPVDRLVQRAGADALGARLEDAVLHDQLVVLAQPRRQVVAESRAPAGPSRCGRSWATPPMRNQFGCMRPPQIASMMSKSALAVVEHVEHRRERARGPARRCRTRPGG